MQIEPTWITSTLTIMTLVITFFLGQVSRDQQARDQKRRDEKADFELQEARRQIREEADKAKARAIETIQSIQQTATKQAAQRIDSKIQETKNILEVNAEHLVEVHETAKEAVAGAQAAYNEANTLNQKIAHLEEILMAQGKQIEESLKRLPVQDSKNASSN